MEHQQSFLTSHKQTQTQSPWTVFIDGASRGNPGPAGVGIYITTTEKCIFKQGFYLHKKTNNQAEYLALVIALLIIKKISMHHKVTPLSLTIVSDSELLVKQMKGIYSVKNDVLATMKAVAQQLLEGLPHRFTHVLREKNTIADGLANDGIDKKNKIPADLLIFLSKHNILV